MIGDDEVFDSRDADERINELEAEHSAHWTDEDRAEHYDLTTLRDGIDLDYPMEWRDGITFIRDDHLADHAKEYAEDIDGVDVSRWPYNAIDWDEAGEKLAEDYRQIEWRSHTWYYH